MAAYDMLMELVQDYFIDLGYSALYVEQYFSNTIFKELISIRLANANVMIRNKTDRSSHQTHIAITGEAIDFFTMHQIFKHWITRLLKKESLCCGAKLGCFK